MKSIYFKKSYNLLESMYNFSIEIRQESLKSNLLQRIGYKHWLKEFCVIKFGLMRQSGHTINSLKLIGKYFKNPLYISKNNLMTFINKNLYSLDGELLLNVSKNIKFATYDTFENRIRENNYAALEFLYGAIDAVLVDTVTFFSEQKKQLLFDVCTPFIKNNPLFTIIFIQ